MTTANTNNANNFGRNFLIYTNVIIIFWSVVVITGWIFNIPIFKSMHVNSVYSKIIESIVLIFAGITLIFYKSHKDSSLIQIFKSSMLWFIFLVGLLSIVSQFFSLGLDLDKFFFGNVIEHLNGKNIMTISPITSLGFVFLAISLYFLNIKKNILFSQSLVLLIFFVSIFALIGYLVNIEHLHGVFTDIPMSFQSSVSLSFLSIGALLTEQKTGLGKILFNKGVTGKHFRKNLVIIAIIPIAGFILFGFLGLSAEIEYEIALFTAIVIFSTAICLMVNSKLVYKTEELKNELAEKDKKFSVIIDNTGDIIATLNTDGDFLFINPAGRSFFDLESEEDITMLNLSNFIKSKDDSKNIFYNIIPESLKNGSSEILCDLINRVQTVIPVFISFISHKSLIGDVDYISIIAKDITEMKITQLALVNSEKKYKSLFEGNKAGVFESTINGKVLNCNKAFFDMFGYSSKEELLDTHAANLHTNQEARDKFLDLLRKDNQLLNYESQTRKKDGSLIWTLENVHLIDGNIIQGTIINITEIKKAEEVLIIAKEKAEEMSRLKSKFLANMSHELRTPLVGIKGYSEILQDEIKDNNHKKMSAAIYESSNNLEETLNSILDLSKIEANKFDINFTPTNISSTVKNCVNHYVALAQSKSLSLISNIKEDNITSVVDEKILNHILNNLINNALKFTNKGTVEVGMNQVIENNKNLVNIYVKDTGIGIQKENLEHVFDEFRQVSEGNNRLYGGTGLGLTLVKKFTNMMNGSISVKSKFGEGSTFTIQLEAVEPTKRNITVEKNIKNKIKEIIPAIGKVPQILYVEDDPNSRTVVGLFLKKKYHLTIVENAVKALELTNKKMFDLILMDINLGIGMNGLDLTQEIKKNKKYKDVPIAAVTANAMVNDKKIFLSYGCTHYISKPFNKITLLNLISSILEKAA